MDGGCGIGVALRARWKANRRPPQEIPRLLVVRVNAGFECRDCVLLWQEYAQINNTYLKIASALQVARIQQDSTAIAELLKQQEVAAEKRHAARKAAKDHAADHLKAKSAKQG